MEDFKYGLIRGGHASTPVPLAASQVIKWKSGRFVNLDGSGNAVISVAGANEIFGHIEESERTSNATAALELAKCIVDPSAVYRIPIDTGTYVAAMRGKTCDIGVTSSIQGADLTANTDKVLVVIDGDLVDNNWVDVMINQKERAQSGVV